MAHRTTLTPNQSLRETVQQFGFPIERFLPGSGPARIVRVAGLIDAVLGFGLAVWATVTGKHIGWTLGGIGLAASGIVVIILARRLSSGGVLVCPRGLIFARVGHVDAVAWEEFRTVREEKNSGAEIRTIVVERKDGASSPIDATTVGNLNRFCAILRKETDRRKIPWKSE